MKKGFANDKWSEYFFNIFSNLTHEQKLRLDASEKYLFRSEMSIRRFADQGTLEEKVVILTKLGYDWFFGLYPVGKDLPAVMKKAYRQHTIKNTRAEVIQDMIESHVFILDNKAVATALAMMGQNNHSDAFYINRHFFQLPKMLEQYELSSSKLFEFFTSQNPIKESAEFRAGLQTMDKLIGLVSQMFTVEQNADFLFKLTRLDIRILLLLFPFRNNYVSLDYLKRHLHPEYSPKAIAARCTFLFMKRNLIDKLPKTNPISYTIKSDGILILGELLNQIMRQSTI